MREIKFRVWDKVNKKMTYGGYFKTLEIDGVNQEWFGMQTPHPDDCELMQYTGLKDKNGKEIYEGDIVKGSIWNWDTPRSFVVELDEIGYAPFLEEYPTAEGDERLSPYMCEVIGNIYENPDLLKEAT